MSEVWRAVHRAQGIPVAVKVLTAEGARVDRFLSALRNEVRAVAGLDHRHVVMILDHGEIPAETAARSGDRLVAGSPYLAMEWASGGSLSVRTGPSSWDELRALLLTLLDALAHAHARHVVHRDLKLSNVLRCTSDDLRPGLKLADFGIARPRHLEGDANAPVGGTVGYMAPEQLLARWQDQGPWTDLYALGCMAYKLACGRAPYVGTAEEIAQAHLFAPVPPLVPVFPVPHGLQEWVEALLDKEHERRLQLAADAAWMLLDLGEAAGPARIPVGVRVRQDTPLGTELETLSFVGHDDPTREERTSSSPGPRSSAVPAPPASVVLAAAAAAGETFGGHPGAPRAVPPIPPTWRTGSEAPRRGSALSGTGLGIYGLRAVGLVDRDDERTRLWSALRRVGDERRARAVILDGPTGTGKSRLAQWLCERAAEVGAATVLEAVHGATGGPTDGLGPTTARALRCAGFEHRAAAPHVLRVLRTFGELDVDEWAALTELIAPSAPDEQPADRAEPVVRFRTATERHEVARRHVARLATERPVVLWLDDVQWGQDALAFLGHLLGAQKRSPSPVLVLATVRVEPLAERPVERTLLEGLQARADVERLPIGRLPEEHWPGLVRELLGLEGRLAAEVESRTAGNPLFAVQLVGDWVQRGVLEPSASGFRLRPGARAELPDDVHAVWTARVEEVAGGRPAQDGAALELAAVLGHEIDGREWEDACRQADLVAPWELVEEMLDRRLAHPGPRGPRESWSFVHGMLRESLERRAAEQGRARRHHRACAQALQRLPGRASAGRVGRHFAAAGDDEAALGPLLAGVHTRMLAGDYPAALELLALREEALLRLGATADDESVCDGIIERARVEVLAGQLDAALRRAEVAEGVARAHGWDRLVARALITRTRGTQRQGRLAEAEALCTEALSLARALGDREIEAEALYGLGIVQFERGAGHAAAASQREAEALFRALGRTQDATMCLYEQAILERRIGTAARALELTREVLAHGIAEGGRALQANAITSLGEIARGAGDFEAAEEHYLRALTLCEAIGSPNAMVGRLNLALARMGRARWAEARAALREVRDDLARAGWQGLLLCAHVELLACDAGLRDWVAWDEDLQAVRGLEAAWDAQDPDLAWAATRAGELATEADEPARARVAWEIALREWRALGETAEVERAEAALAKLP